jgi:cell division protein ZapA
VKSNPSGVAPVTVQILDKEFLIACPQEEREALLSSARYLSERMREVRDTGKVIGLDRISVMAGLNIANELLKEKNHNRQIDSEVLPRLTGLQARMQQLIDEGRHGTIDF